MKSHSIRKMTTAALLIAIGILIPMFMPVKIMIEPASFTLASHVAIFIAMMLSPAIAAAVAVGTAIGFFISFPLVVALRASSHLIFAVLGALYLRKYPTTLNSMPKAHIFSFLIGLLHGISEVVVVSIFYFGGSMGAAYYQQGFFQSVLLLVGLGTVVHSMVDFEIALVLYKVLGKQRGFASLKSS